MGKQVTLFPRPNGLHQTVAGEKDYRDLGSLGFFRQPPRQALDNRVPASVTVGQDGDPFSRKGAHVRVHQGAGHCLGVIGGIRKRCDAIGMRIVADAD